MQNVDFEIVVVGGGIVGLGNEIKPSKAGVRGKYAP